MGCSVAWTIFLWVFPSWCKITELVSFAYIGYDASWCKITDLHCAKGPKVQRSKGPKVQRSKGPKVQRSKGPKVQRSKGPKGKGHNIHHRSMTRIYCCIGARLQTWMFLQVAIIDLSDHQLAFLCELVLGQELGQEFFVTHRVLSQPTSNCEIVATRCASSVAVWCCENLQIADNSQKHRIHRIQRVRLVVVHLAGRWNVLVHWFAVSTH